MSFLKNKSYKIIKQITAYVCLFIIAFFLVVFSPSFIKFFENEKQSKLLTPALRNDMFQDLSYIDKNIKVVCNQKDNERDKISIKSCLKFQSEKKNILWIGNSQLYTINQPNKDDRSQVIISAKNLHKKNINLKVLAYPNINLYEMNVLYKFVNSNIKVDTLIIPLFFDDTRERGVRSDIRKLLGLEEKKINNFKNINNEKKNLNNQLEEKILNSFQKCCNWRQATESLKVRISVFFYNLRNFVFNIKPSSVRRLILSSYKENTHALEKILLLSKRNKIKVLGYIPPIRNDVPIPYNSKEYNYFKNDMQQKFKKYSFKLINLEKIVPNNEWGSKESTSFGKKEEIDFMHFKFKGHQLVSKKILEELKIYDF